MSKADEYAVKVLELAHDTITVRFRFFDSILSRFKIKAMPETGIYSCDGEYLYYDPQRLLKDYLDEPAFAIRLLLHVMFHYIFLHPLRFDKSDEELWNMASDIAVENVILNMNIPGTEMSLDDERRMRIGRIKKWVPQVTAEKLYREFAAQGVSADAKSDYKRLFTFDRHRMRAVYRDDPATVLTKEDFRKISERVKAELKSFSKDAKGREEILENIGEAVRKRYDYEDILKRFAVMSEAIKINPDEFDYIYYTYGLNSYRNMPLIEPLEYTEDKKIRDFVIAIDTSASCRGELVKGFMEKTVDILRRSDAFHRKVNIRIVQCDSEISDVTLIEDMDDLKGVMDEFKLKGFGATDFRPVFSYVDDLIAQGELEDFKGMIYFTDGYGIYPMAAPEYDTVFVFTGEDANRPKMPPWAIKCIIEDE